MNSGVVTPNTGKPDLHDIRPFGTNRRSGCERSEIPDNLEKVEPDAEIGQKGHLWMGTIYN